MKKSREIQGKWFAVGLSVLIAITGVTAFHMVSGEAVSIAAEQQPIQMVAALPAQAVTEEQAEPESEPEAFRHPLLAAAAAAGGFTPVPQAPSKDEEVQLAGEMARLLTRDARQLVSVIGAAVREEEMALPMTFLLAIAYVETHGRVLAVSPAGAAGLAQATPSAYLLEGFNGRIFLTNDYLVGTRAYIMKKPLADAQRISTMLISANDAATRQRARALLASAFELRQEGMEELTVLAPHAPPVFMQRVEAADAYNLAALEELERLIDRGASAAQMRQYRDRVRSEYRSLMTLQRLSWARYQKDLETKRNELLRKRYGMDPAQVMTTRAYEAGEYLGRELDARFSPSEMARFLSVHLGSKHQQAASLGVPESEIEGWTAALYNGGSHNIKRMRAGLMTSLTETQNYMKKVPATRERLERALRDVS